MTDRATKEKEPGFEEALRRLEVIVKEMEGGKLSLDHMMAHFEEGSELVGKCTAKLDAVERKIETLIKKGDQIATKPLESTESA